MAAARQQRGPIVYWEKQGPDRMCALHCLNSLLQGPYFTEAELSAIGLELDQKERQLMAEGGIHSEDYQAFLAEGSGNVAADGYFNISVLIECLRRRRIHCICQKKQGEFEDPGTDFGYILNHADHWFAIRKVNGVWYNLDSVKPAPSVLTQFYLNTFLLTLKDEGYTIFVVRPEVGDLPAPGFMQTRSNNQFYLTQEEMEALHESAEQEMKREASDARRIAGEDDAPFKGFVANGPSSKTPHVWPEGGGYRLNGQPAEDATSTQDEETADDPELREAIRLSMECYRQEIPKPAEEPAAAASGVKTICVRTPSGKRLSRRFRGEDTMQKICEWIIFESQTLEGIRPLSAASTFSLVQAFPRRRFCSLGSQILLFADSSGDGVDVTEVTLSSLDFHPQDQLMLQV